MFRLPRQIFILAFVALSFGAQAQFDFGIKGGLNSSTITFDNLEENSTIEDLAGNNEFGYHAGVYIRVKILGLYIQPEFLYSNLNSQIEVQKKNGETGSQDFTLSRFDVPVNVGVKFGPASIFGGPVMSYNLNHPSEILDIDYKGGTLGFQAGLGLTFGNFIMDLKYEGSFQSLAEEVVIDGQTYEVDSRTGQFILSLGYALF